MSFLPDQSTGHGLRQLGQIHSGECLANFALASCNFRERVPFAQHNSDESNHSAKKVNKLKLFIAIF